MSALATAHAAIGLTRLSDWLDYNGFTVVTKSAKEFVDAEGRSTGGNIEIGVAVGAAANPSSTGSVRLNGVF